MIKTPKGKQEKETKVTLMQLKLTTPFRNFKTRQAFQEIASYHRC